MKWKIKGQIEIIAMPNDYLIFIFDNLNDRDYILSKPWFYWRRRLFLEKWQPWFNPTKAKLMNAPCWIILLHLSFEFWHQKVFEGIAGSFRKFITTDEVTKARTRLIEARFYIIVEYGVNLQKTIMLESKLGE